MATQEEKKEALAKIEEKVKAAHKLIEEAQAVADEAKVIFNFSVGYGMGGTYVPEGMDEDEWYSSDTGWVSSSSNC